MKKLMIIAFLITLGFLLTACNSGSDFDETSKINVYTRDTSSGTRDGFMKGIGFDAAATDDSILVSGFVTAGNLEQVNAAQEDLYMIGYVSLSTLNTTLFKGFSFNGVEPTEANVLNGTYMLARRFNYMLRDDYSVYGNNAEAYEAISKAFVAYMKSTEGLASILEAGGIVDVSSGLPWSTIVQSHPICLENNSSLTFKIGGSDSVEAIATSISPDFSSKCGNVVIEHNHTGSSNAYRGTNGNASAISDALSIHIGFASREFQESEPAIITGTIAIDAIVAIGHLNNPVNNLTAQDLKDIYSGVKTEWEDFID
ncbi:substrate-binding domain-containing protein [Liberiplasma polymorphum]|uniref:substrate-binding domain-containing protein n=1 Tax=Liberiplasma polymorphum TaxID=3374570 RepID=UPI003770E3A7